MIYNQICPVIVFGFSIWSKFTPWEMRSQVFFLHTCKQIGEVSTGQGCFWQTVRGRGWHCKRAGIMPAPASSLWGVLESNQWPLPSADGSASWRTKPTELLALQQGFNELSSACRFQLLFSIHGIILIFILFNMNDLPWFKFCSPTLILGMVMMDQSGIRVRGKSYVNLIMMPWV